MLQMSVFLNTKWYFVLSSGDFPFQFPQDMNKRHVDNMGNLKVAYTQATNKQCESREFAALYPGEIQSIETCVKRGCCRDHTNSVCYVNDGMLRLHDGVSPTSGRLEIFHNGQWGTVSSTVVARTNLCVVQCQGKINSF